jgi:uncharacterized membrane protein (DUF2068 family)
MKYLKFIQYFYLIAAALFLYDAIFAIIEGNKSPFLSFILAGLAIFMFFFRRKFSRRFDQMKK